jgi:hypothetical protein
MCGKCINLLRLYHRGAVFDLAGLPKKNTAELKKRDSALIDVKYLTCLTTRLVVKQVLHFFGLKRMQTLV